MYEFLDYRVRDVMTSPAITVGPEARLAQVDALLEEHDVNGLPVVADDGSLVGFVTRLDLLRRGAPRRTTSFRPTSTSRGLPLPR